VTSGTATRLETTTRRGKEALQHGPSLKRRAPYHSIKTAYMTRCIATAIMRNVGSFGRSHDAVWIMTNSSSQEAKLAHLALADSSMIEWRRYIEIPGGFCSDKSYFGQALPK
jgi:hypothetical protein